LHGSEFNQYGMKNPEPIIEQPKEEQSENYNK